MKYTFVDESWEDYLYWQKTNKKILKRINNFLKDNAGNPYSGSGKPEPLKYKYKGFWSRRIDEEHRLIYQPGEDEILIAKCRFHYELTRCAIKNYGAYNQVYIEPPPEASGGRLYIKVSQLKIYII